MANRLVLAVSVIVAVGGCNGSSDRSAIGPDNSPQASTPPGPGDSTAGSRLKSRYYVADDGSRQWIGWHDTQLDVDCGFALASDGKTRCMPTSVGSVSGSFADSSCSQPLAAALGGCSVPKLAVQIDTANASCSGVPYRAFNVGAPFTGTTAYVKSGGCTSVSVTGGTTLYQTTGERPPSDFVAATEQVQ